MKPRIIYRHLLLAVVSYYCLLSVSVSANTSTAPSAPSLYSCVDWDCEDWISKGKTLIRYAGKTDKHLSFNKNVEILIISKPVDKSLPDWVGKVGNKVGLVPKDYVKEEKMSKSPPKFKLELHDIPALLAKEENEENKVDVDDHDHVDDEEGEEYEGNNIEIEDVGDGSASIDLAATTKSPLSESESPVEQPIPSSNGKLHTLEIVPEIVHLTTPSSLAVPVESESVSYAPSLASFLPQSGLDVQLADETVPKLDISSDPASEMINLQPSTDTVLQGATTVEYLTETPKTVEQKPTDDITPRIPETVVLDTIASIQNTNTLLLNDASGKIESFSASRVEKSSVTEEETQFSLQMEEKTLESTESGTSTVAPQPQGKQKEDEERLVSPRKVESLMPEKLLATVKTESPVPELAEKVPEVEIDSESKQQTVSDELEENIHTAETVEESKSSTQEPKEEKPTPSVHQGSTSYSERDEEEDEMLKLLKQSDEVDDENVEDEPDEEEEPTTEVEPALNEATPVEEAIPAEHVHHHHHGQHQHFRDINDTKASSIILVTKHLSSSSTGTVAPQPQGKQKGKEEEERLVSPRKVESLMPEKLLATIKTESPAPELAEKVPEVEIDSESKQQTVSDELEENINTAETVEEGKSSTQEPKEENPTPSVHQGSTSYSERDEEEDEMLKLLKQSDEEDDKNVEDELDEKEELTTKVEPGLNEATPVEEAIPAEHVHHHHHHGHRHHFRDINDTEASSIILVIKHLSSTLLSFLPEALQDTILDVDDALVFTGIIALTLVSICVPYFLIEGYMSVRPLKRKVVELNKSLWKVSAAFETQQEEFEIFKQKAIAHDEYKKRAEQSENDVVILKKLETKHREQITALKTQLKSQMKEAVDIRALIEKTLGDKKVVVEECEQYKAAYESTKEALVSSKEELSRIQNQAKSSALLLSTSGRNVEVLSAKNAMLQQQAEEMKAQVSAENEKRKAVEIEKQKLEQAKSTVEKELSEFKSICHQYEETVSGLNDEISKLESELSSIKETLGDDSPLLEIAEVQAKAAFLEKESASLRTRLDGLTADNENISSKLKETTRALEEAREEKEQTSNRLQVLEKYFKEREEEYIKTVEQLQLKESVRDKGKEELIRIIEEKENVCKDLEERLETLKEEFEETKQQHRNEIRALEAKGHENWLSLCQAERKAQDARKEAKLLRQRLTALTKEKDDEDVDGLNGEVPMFPVLPDELVPLPILDEPPSYFGLGDFIPPPPLPEGGEREPHRPPPLGGLGGRMSPSFSDLDDNILSPIGVGRREDDCTDGSSGSDSPRRSPPLRGGWVNGPHDREGQGRESMRRLSRATSSPIQPGANL